MANYHWNPEDYHRSSSAQQRFALEMIERIVFDGSEKVLDIGSGDGKVTAEIAARVPRGMVVGIDNSPDMVEFACRTFPPDRHLNLRFEHGDAYRLPFENEFDLVFSNATLHWIPDQCPVVVGIARALRSGGRTFLQMGGRGNAAKIFQTAQNLMREMRWGRHFRGLAAHYRFHGPEEYRSWLSMAGLKARRVELIPKDMVHEGREGLSGWIRTTWLPFLEALPEDRRAEFVRDLVDNYLSVNPLDAEGRTHVSMVRLEVEAEK